MSAVSQYIACHAREALRIIFAVLVVDPACAHFVQCQSPLDRPLTIVTYEAAPPPGSQSTCCRNGQCQSVFRAWYHLSPSVSVFCRSFRPRHTDILPDRTRVSIRCICVVIERGSGHSYMKLVSVLLRNWSATTPARSSRSACTFNPILRKLRRVRIIVDMLAVLLCSEDCQRDVGGQW